MPREAIQCQDLFPELKCTLWLVGEPDVVESALRDHLANTHNQRPDDLGQQLKAKARRAIQIGRKQAYVGEDFQHDEETGKVKIGGPTVVVSEVMGDGLTTLTCDCGTFGGGTCKTRTTASGLAMCESGTCTACGWSTVSTGLVDAQFVTE